MLVWNERKANEIKGEHSFELWDNLKFHLTCISHPGLENIENFILMKTGQVIPKINVYCKLIDLILMYTKTFQNEDIYEVIVNQTS